MANSYCKREFDEWTKDSKLVPDPPAGNTHLHFILDRGNHPVWAVCTRRSKFCGTARCQEVAVYWLPDLPVLDDPVGELKRLKNGKDHS